MKQIIDLSILLNYFDSLNKQMDKIYPVKLTWDNIDNYNFDLNIQHPNWIKKHFPLVLIYHKAKAGKLRNSKKESIMYQNHNNILTQLVWSADDFGTYHRKNKHKGFNNIVASFTATEKDINEIYIDQQKPKKFKNFIEFSNLYDPTDINIKSLCEVLEKNYPCNSTGQLRLI